MTVAILTLITALLPVILEIVKTILKKHAEEATNDAALAKRSLDELSAGYDRVRGPQPPVQ